MASVNLSYKLRLYPTRNKADCLAGLTALFARCHADATHHLVAAEGRPCSTKGFGEFVGRAYWRASTDYRRTLKAARVTGRPFTPPTLHAELIDSADVQLPKQASRFDYWVMVKGTKEKGGFYVPAKGHRGLNRALTLPGAELNLGTKGSAEVFRKNGKWYARVNVKVPVADVREPNGWLGCDVGVRCSIFRSDGYRGRSLTPVVHGPHRSKKKAPHHQRHRRYAPTFQRQILAREARKAVSVAQRSGRGISLEDPRRLPRWGGWAARQFAKRVELLALIAGVAVRLLKPAYSSQTCSRCHSRDTYRRKEMFRCRACRFTRHADENAALNIASGSYGITAVSHASLSPRSPSSGGGGVE